MLKRTTVTALVSVTLSILHLLNNLLSGFTSKENEEFAHSIAE